MSKGINVADIDALLREIDESNAAGIVDKPNPSGNSAKKAEEEASRRHSAAVSFSTYIPPPPEILENNVSPPRPPQGKLTPLANAARLEGSPQPKSHGAFVADPAAISEAIRKARAHSQDASGYSQSPESASNATSSMPPLEVTGATAFQHHAVNFLPVMHARQLVGIGGITPKPRWGNTLTKVGDSLYLFGGTTSDGIATNDFFQYLPSYNSFEPIHIKGSLGDDASASPARGDSIHPPGGRCHHTAAEYQGRYLIVFGGSTEMGTVLLNDIHAFDTASQRWQRIGEEGRKHEPTGRFGHTAVVAGNKMYVFGGRSVKKGEGAAGLVLTNDVLVFCLDTFSWKKRVHVGKADESETANSKLAPPKRFHHGACLIGSTMFIHGGEGAAGQYLSDTWAFDVMTREWRLVHNAVDSIPRSRHALFGCGEALLAFGGVATATPHQQVPLAVLAVMETDPDTGVVTPVPQPSIQGWIPVSLGANANTLSASKKNFGATCDNGFVYAFGGVTTNGQSCNEMIRCLAMDGVPIATQPLVALQAQMKRVQEDTTYVDMYLEGLEGVYPREDGKDSNSRVGCHRLILQHRAPKFLADILTCRSEIIQPSTLPAYTVTSSSRSKGLMVSFTPSSLRLLLDFVYTAEVPQLNTNEWDINDNDIKILIEAAKTYELSSLHAHLTVTHSEKERRVAIEGLQQELANMLGYLCDAGVGASATLVFEDVDTHIETIQAGHPFLLCIASDYFRQLLKPVVFEGKGAHQAHRGVTARKMEGATGKRSIVVGKIPIPKRGVKYVMRYLYNRSLSVPPEDALMTMIAANTLHLPDLQAHCESIVAREEVNYESACAYCTLAHHHNAPLLAELSMLTAALGFFEPELFMQDSIPFTNLPEATKTSIKAIAAQLQGKWAPPAESITVQAAPDAYQRRMQQNMAQ